MSNNSIAAPVSGHVTGAQIRIVSVVVLGAFLALLNQTVMSPALPVIMADFAIDASTAQWIMSIYPLVSGIMVPVSAYLIDKFSTRALFFGSTNYKEHKIGSYSAQQCTQCKHYGRPKKQSSRTKFINQIC